MVAEERLARGVSRGARRARHRRPGRIRGRGVAVEGGGAAPREPPLAAVRTDRVGIDSTGAESYGSSATGQGP
jgi:hypothetical protein